MIKKLTDIKQARHNLDLFSFMAHLAKIKDSWSEGIIHNTFFSPIFYKDPLLFHFFELFEICSGVPFFSEIGKVDSHIEIEMDVGYDMMDNTISKTFYSYVPNGDGTFKDMMLCYTIHNVHIMGGHQNSKVLDESRELLYQTEQYHPFLPSTTDLYLESKALGTSFEEVPNDHKFWFEKRIFSEESPSSFIEVIVADNIDDWSDDNYVTFDLMDFSSSNEPRDYDYFKDMINNARQTFRCDEMDVFFRYWDEHFDKR